MKIFSGESSKYFTEQICEHLEISLGESEKKVFSDGEFLCIFHETVRGQTVYLVQSTFSPIDNFFELLQMSDLCKRAGAEKVVAVIPYLGFSRQERKSKPRVPITASLMAKMIESSGVDHIITMDLHAEAIQGFYNIPVSHIYASALIIPYIKNKLFSKDLIVVSPDMGGTKRAKMYSQFLKTDMAICHKNRETDNKVNEMILIGDVKNRDVIIVDDIIDTGGTLCKCSDMLIENGANSVSAVITHPVLSGNAYEKILNSSLKELVVTDSIPLKTLETSADNSTYNNKIKVISATSMFADIIKNVENHQSISVNFL